MDIDERWDEEKNSASGGVRLEGGSRHGARWCHARGTPGRGEDFRPMAVVNRGETKFGEIAGRMCGTSAVDTDFPHISD